MVNDRAGKLDARSPLDNAVVVLGEGQRADARPVRTAPTGLVGRSVRRTQVGSFQADGDAEMTAAPEVDLFLVRTGTMRFEIPEAVGGWTDGIANVHWGNAQ